MNKKEYTKIWKIKNRDKMIKYRKEYRKRHPEKVLEYEKSQKRKNLRKLAREKSIRNMAQLRFEHGNKCHKCEYDRHPKILQFHHLKNKKFEISKKKYLAISKLRIEAKKCILLCPNCHFEAHI